MTTPISDREVGALEPLPLPPHHVSTAAASLFRSDSDVSATSSTTSSVPRSSSFTRSKRFLTGDGLSNREALGIIDHHDRSPIPHHTNPPPTLVHSFDLARSAMLEVYQETSAIQPPPPPKIQLSADDEKRRSSTAPPPAPPLPKRLSGIVWADDIDDDDDDDKENERAGPSSTAPQSPESLASLSPKADGIGVDQHNAADPPIVSPDRAKRRVRSPLAGAVNRKRRSVKNTLTPTDTQNADREAGILDQGPSPFASPVPRSKTIARLRGLFSPRASPSSVPTEQHPLVPPFRLSVDAAEIKPEQRDNEPDGRDLVISKPTVVKVAGPVPPSEAASSVSQKTKGSNADVLEKQSASISPSLPRKDPGKSPSGAGNGTDALVKEKPVVVTNAGSARRNTVAPNREQAHPNAFHIAAPAALREHVQNISTAESAAALKKESVRKRTDLFKRFKMIQERARFDVSSSGSKPTPQPLSSGAEDEEPVKLHVVPAVDNLVPPDSMRIEDYPEAKSSEAAAPPSNDDTVSFLTAAEDFPPPEKNSKPVDMVIGSPKGNDPSEAGSSPGQASLTSPTVESMTTSSSSQSRGDRYCAHPGAVDANADAYNMRSTAPVQPQGPVLAANTTHPLSHFGMPIARAAPTTGVSAHGFMGGPVFEAIIEDAGQLRHMRRDSHAAYVNAYIEAMPKEPILSLPEVNIRESDIVNTSEALGSAVGEKAPESQMKRTKSGLQKRLAKAKDAGAGIVARAKKVPRGASFPRLRSWGESSSVETKSCDGTKRDARSSDVKAVKAEDEVATTKSEIQKDAAVVTHSVEAAAVSVPESKEATRPIQENSVTTLQELPASVATEKSCASKIDIAMLSAAASDRTAPPMAAPTATDKLKANDHKVYSEQKKTEPKVKMANETEPKNSSGKEAVTKPTKAVPVEKTKLQSKTTKAVTTEKSAKVVPEQPSKSQDESVESVDKAKTQAKAKQKVSAGECQEEGKYVTIQRVIRRVKRDGSEEVVRKKMRVKAEKVLPNGDVVVRRTMKRMKEDGSGHETLTVMQLIPRRRKKSGTGEDDGADAGSNEAGKARAGGDVAEVVVDKRGARLSERSISTPSGSLEGRRSRKGGEGEQKGLGEHGGSATVRLPRSKTLGNLGDEGEGRDEVKGGKGAGRKWDGGFRRTKSGKMGWSKSGVSSAGEAKGQSAGNGRRNGRGGLWTLGLVPRVISFHGRERKG